MPYKRLIKLSVSAVWYLIFFFPLFTSYANYKDYKLDGVEGQSLQLDEGKEFGEAQVLYE